MSKQQWAVGIDLGGTKIEVALVDSNGHLHDRLRIPTESKLGHKEILQHIIDNVHKIIQQNKGMEPSVIGIGVAGQIEKKTGIVHYAPNLEWHEVNLQAELAKELDKAVAVCNDVRAVTWGEWLHGAGKGCDDLVCVFVGTGIGGGIVSGGHLLEGVNNTAGEIGHITIDMNGPKCHCGNIGCLEAFAGGWAIQRDAQAAVRKDKAAGEMLLELAQGNVATITAKTVSEAAQKNDMLAKKILDKAVEALVAGSVTIVNSFGPSRLIFGGGVMEGMPELLSRVEKGVNTSALKAATTSLQILPATLHNDSGVVGAAAFALRTLGNPKNR